MYQIKFNDKLTLNLASDIELRERGLNPDDFIPLNQFYPQIGSLYVTRDRLTKEDLTIICGIDQTTFDYAVPQAWYEDQMRQGKNPFLAVWLYPEGDFFGQPFDLNQWRKRVIEKIRNGHYTIVDLD